MNDFTKDELDGFKMEETGYGFDDEGCLYSYARCEETDYMGNLYKTRTEAIERRMRELLEEIHELHGLLLREHS